MQTTLKGKEYDVGLFSLFLNIFLFFDIANNTNLISYYANTLWLVIIISISTLLAMLLAYKTTSGAISIILGFVNILILISMIL